MEYGNQKPGINGSEIKPLPTPAPAYDLGGSIPTSDSFLVGFDMGGGDMPCIVIGRRNFRGETDIVNLITGAEAIELYYKLTKIEKEK